MGRPKVLPRRQVLLRLPEDLFAEILLLNPQLQDETGFRRYGALSQYFTGLARADVERRKDALRRGVRT